MGCNGHGEVAIEEEVCVLWPVFCSGSQGWRSPEGLWIEGLQEETQERGPAAVAGDESRLLRRSLRLCEGVAPEEEAFSSLLRQDDTRRDTPFKDNKEVCFADPGGQDRHDTRRDHPAKAQWGYVCCIWVMIQDEMDERRVCDLDRSPKPVSG